MVLFWILSVLLVALSLLFIWWPVFKRRAEVGREVDRNQLNIQIFKGRVAELEAELNQGNLKPDTFEELKAELEQNLLQEVDDQRVETHRGNPVALSLVVSLAVPALAFFLYLQWGASDRLAMPAQQQAAHPETGHDLAGIDQQIANLRAKLEANPGNSQGWFTLGRTYVTLQRYQEAYEAFVKVGEIVGEHAEILSQQAQALYYLNDHQFTPRIQAIVDRARQLDPEDPGTLGLLGIYAYETGQYVEAIKYWQQVVKGNRPNANIAGLQNAIAQAKQQLAARGIEYNAEEVAAAGGAEIRVLVELDPALKAQADADTTVFVYAQALQGPRMPLAVARFQVRDLPKLVTLNDAMAMGPMMKLSSVDQVQISATVSHSGTPGAKSGDLQGVVRPVATQGSDEVVKVNIDQVVP